MKIKSDFVTNSSSVSFIVSIDPNEIFKLKQFIEKLEEHHSSVPGDNHIYFVCDNMQCLLDYTNGREYDWAAQARGLQFFNLEEKTFENCKKIIEDGHVAAKVRINNNISGKFVDTWQDHIVESND